jgi:hypothetical protein
MFYSLININIKMSEYIEYNLVLFTKSIAMADIVLEEGDFPQGTRNNNSNSILYESCYNSSEFNLSTASLSNDKYKGFIDDNELSKREISDLLCKI